MVDGWPRQVFDGGVFRARYPGAPLIISDPAVAAEVLVERSAEFPHGEVFDRIFAPIWGKGILVSEGSDWRWQRRAAAPAFRPAQMASLAPVMGRAADKTLARWSTGAPINLHDDIRKLTLRVIFDAVLSGGEDFPDKEEASRQIDAFTSNVGRISVADIVPMPERWRPSSAARGGESAAYIRDRVTAMIARRRREARPRGDLIDLLISATDQETGQAMDDTLLRDNLVGFIAAGHETSTYALSWALWLVASHGATRDRLLAEIKAVAGDDPIGGEDVERLIFTRQVIEETMRLYPAAVAIVRAAAGDTQVAGHRLRRGAPVMVAVYALHRLADVWDQPDAFDPARFGPERRAGRPEGAYLPFGAGPRVCMGAAFAMTELIVALATLVRGSVLIPNPSRPVRPGVRLGGVVSTTGLWVTPNDHAIKGRP